MIHVGLERTSLLISIVFALWLAILFLNKTKFILREGLAYLKNFWSVLDLTIIIISLACIILFVARIKSIGQFQNSIEKSRHNEFISYFNLFHMHMTLNLIGTLLVCVSTIRLWKLVRFYKVFRMFEKTFHLVIGPVVALFLHHVIFVIVYTFILHILLGQNSSDFLNFRLTFQSLVKIYLSAYNNYDVFIEPYATRIVMVFIVVYIIVSKTFFATYIVMCVLAHLDARELFAQYQVEAYSFVDYVKEELMFLFTWFKLRRTHHKERPLRKQVIFPKPDRYLYANCISTTSHAMNAMSVVAAIVLYNKIHTNGEDGVLTEKQIEMMLRVCHYFLSEHTSKDHKNFFFKVHQGQVLKIVDSKRIDKAKQVVDVILGVSAKLEKRQKLNRRIVLRHSIKDFDKVQKKLELCLQSLENIEFVEEDVE